MKNIAIFILALTFAAPFAYAAPMGNGLFDTIRINDTETSFDSTTLRKLSAAMDHSLSGLNYINYPVTTNVKSIKNSAWNNYAQIQTEVEVQKIKKSATSWRDSSNRGIKSKLMVMYRLVDELNLDEEVASEFFSVFLRYVTNRDKLAQDHRELIIEISEKADNEDVSVGDLKKLASDLKKHQQRNDKHRTEFMKNAKKILDDRQYIKLLVFEDKLKHDLMSQFRFSRRHGKREMSEDDRVRMEKEREVMRKKLEAAESKYKDIIEKELEKIKQ